MSCSFDKVRRFAAPMGITVRPELEPGRNLNQRTDHWPFLRIGVPATNFVFGYDPGTDAERPAFLTGSRQ